MYDGKFIEISQNDVSNKFFINERFMEPFLANVLHKLFIVK